MIGGVTWQMATSKWHLKSKCRLADTEVNVAVRLSVDVSAFTEASVQIAFRGLSEPSLGFGCSRTRSMRGSGRLGER